MTTVIIVESYDTSGAVFVGIAEHGYDDVASARCNMERFPGKWLTTDLRLIEYSNNVNIEDVDSITFHSLADASAALADYLVSNT